MARHASESPKDPGLSNLPATGFMGSLREISDSERNALRSIGSTAREAALLTSALLAGLVRSLRVLIFQGVLPEGADIPRIPHVVARGHRVVLIESVIWPPGVYHAEDGGRVHCDGVYIGQSIGPLLAAVSYWRRALPPGHQVIAVVIVHEAQLGTVRLPGTSPDGVTWTGARDAVQVAARHLSADRRAASAGAVAALLRATEGKNGP